MIRSLLAACAVLCLPIAEAQSPAVGAEMGDIPGEWVFLRTKTGAFGWDLASLERDTRQDMAYITGFSLFQKPRTREGVEYAITVDDIAIQCRDNLWTAYGLFALDEDLVIVDEGSTQGDWRLIEPDSPMMRLRLAACDGIAPPRGEAADNLKSALASARDNRD